MTELGPSLGESQGDAEMVKRNPITNAKGGSADKIESQEGLWRVCYENIGKNVLIKKSTLKNLKLSETEIANVTALIETHQSSDSKFKVPLKILQAVIGANLERTVQDRVCQCVTFALVNFAGLDNLVAWPLTGSELTLREVVGRARPIVADANLLVEFGENVAKCVALIMVAGQKWDFDRFVTEMTSNVWGVGAKQLSRTIQAGSLSESSHHQQLAILGKKIRIMAQEHERDSFKAREQASEVSRKLDLLKEQLIELGDSQSHLQGANERAREEIASLKQTLAAEQESASVNRTHYADDFENLRGDVTRRLSAQSELLTDGIYALKAGHQSIAEEYVDRALRAINTEIARLRERERRS